MEEKKVLGVKRRLKSDSSFLLALEGETITVIDENIIWVTHENLECPKAEITTNNNVKEVRIKGSKEILNNLMTMLDYGTGNENLAFYEEEEEECEDNNDNNDLFQN